MKIGNNIKTALQALVKGPMSVNVLIEDGREFQSLAVEYSKDFL